MNSFSFAKRWFCLIKQNKRSLIQYFRIMCWMHTAGWHTFCLCTCARLGEDGGVLITHDYTPGLLWAFIPFPFFPVSSAWHGRGNQPHRASSAATLCSRSDYNLGWLDCLQSHSENQASWMLAKWPFGIIHLPSRRDLAPCLRHYVQASVCCMQCGLLDSWKLWASSGREAAF